MQTQMAQKPMLRAEVYARALRASQNVKRAEVYRKPVFRICLIRWAAFCLLRSFLELFLSAANGRKARAFRLPYSFVKSRRFHEAALRVIVSPAEVLALCYHGRSGYKPLPLAPNPDGVVVCTAQRVQISVDRRW
jgi:hypothetical protein